MPEAVRLVGLEFASADVTERTRWTFAEAQDDSGLRAIVEITSGDNTPETLRLLPEMLSRLGGEAVAKEADVPGLLGLTSMELRRNRGLATAVSALRTAVVDFQAQKDNVAIAKALGGQPVESVHLYANINRHLLTRERTPSAFGRAAERAAGAGFTIIKCAPFDEVRPPDTVEGVLEAARPGIERVAAVRAAVGPDIEVLVDCHSRFDVHTAPIVAEELAKLDVGWFEEPLPPAEDTEGLVEVARKVTMPLAGGESGYGEDFFAELIKGRAVGVIMPDIKFCGGVAVACRAGRAALRSGGQVSLHSPSGPVSLLGSAHVTAAMPGAMALEHAVYEADWRAELLTPCERVEDGKLWFPDGIGLGAKLNDELVDRYGQRWRP